MVIAAVIVVAVADPTVSPVQAVTEPSGEVFLAQFGADIDGEAEYDESGTSVALSADGLTAIIGAPDNDGLNGSKIDSGQARIYTWDEGSWVQLGGDIDGGAAGDQFGYSVALSDDDLNGLTVIIGAPGKDIDSDSGQARIYTWDEGSWVQLGGDIDGGAAGDQFGYSVALSADGDTAIIGAPGADDIETGPDSGKATSYKLVRAEESLQMDEIFYGEANFDGFGSSVALSADGETAIIGAPYNGGDGNNFIQRGHARIYTWDNTNGWGQLGADIDGEFSGDYSGSSVALSADDSNGLTVIIGAPSNDDVDYNTGQARIYTWDSSDDGIWMLQGDIDGEAENDQFGSSVALSADGLTALIGAPYGEGAGLARLYKLNPGSSEPAWVPQGADTDGEAEFDEFGSSVALSADGTKAMIGAPYNTNGSGEGAGHARIYELRPVTAPGAPQMVPATPGDTSATLSWSAPASNGGSPITGYTATSSSDEATCSTMGALECTVTGLTNGTNYRFTVIATNSVGDSVASEAATVTPMRDPYDWSQIGEEISGEGVDGEEDQTGFSVALSADGGTAIVGAPQAYNDDKELGQARIYTLTDGEWVLQGTLNGEGDGDQFGSSVALSADGGTAIVGAPNNDSNGPNSGQARIYTLTDAGWGNEQQVEINGERPDDKFGSSVALSADGLTAIIGAPNNDGPDNVNNNSGHARIYTLTDGEWVNEQRVEINGEEPHDKFGSSVALSADGLTAIVGAPGSGDIQGYARIYTLTDGEWDNEQQVEINGGFDGDEFGSSVALSADGRTAIIGALYDYDDDDYAGYAQIYTFTDADGWEPLGDDIVGDPQEDQFGSSVALSADGRTAIIGARYNLNDNGSNSGQARIYTFTDADGWDQLGEDFYGEARNDESGYSVALSADGLTAIIGAPGNDGYVRIYGSPISGAPHTVTATAGDTSVAVEWSAPASTGGSSITEYTVTASPGGATCSPTATAQIARAVAAMSVAAPTCTVTGLTNGTSYTFTVTATNAAGTSSPSTPSNTATPAAPVTATPVSPPIVPVPFPPYLGGLSLSLPGSFLTVTIYGCAINEVVTFVLIGFTLVATCASSAVVLTPGAAALTVGTGTASATFTAPSAPGDYEVTVTGSAGFTGSVPISVIPVVPSVPVLPGRVFESRSGSADFVTVDGLFQGAGRTGAGQVVEVQVTGRAGVPVDAEAVFLNVVAVDPSGSGYLTVFPCGATPPLAANVNYNTGDIAANAVFAKIDDDGKVCVYTHAETDLVIDVNGYTPAGADTKSVVPGRVLESRSGNGLITADGLFQGVGRTGAGEVREVQVTGRAGVPVNAEAVFLNVVAVSPSGPGYLTVFPCGATPPLAANVNYDTGDIAANAVFAKIDDDGKVCVYTLAETDLVIDVNGYTLVGADTKSVVPGRVLESRSGNGLITADGLFQGVGRTGAGEVREVQVTGRAGVPVDAEAVLLNVVAVDPSGPGYLTVFPCGAAQPLAANVNYNTGDIAAKAVFAKIGDDGKVCVYTLAETDLVIDVNGYTQASAT
jgi:hypothetical protein